MFERLPKLKVLFAHGGGSFPGTIGRIRHGFNVRPDLVAVDNNVDPIKYMGRFWSDSLVHDEKQLDNIVDLFGEDKVCCGSDYPFPLGEMGHDGLTYTAGQQIEGMEGWSSERKAKCLGLNACEWLGVDPTRFM